jgi:hypothetical protein
MRREEESAMPPIHQNQVEKELGEIIVANNPANKLMQPVPPPATTFKKPTYSSRQIRFTAWPGSLQSALGGGMGFTPPISAPPNYQVEGVYEIDYVNEGEPPDEIHRLWIIYGSGGK